MATLNCDGDGELSGRSTLVEYARMLGEARIAAYRVAPHDVEEHANIEMSVLAGGYAYRQIAELVQNAADAIMERSAHDVVGRITVEIDDKGLWVANTGAPLDEAGVKALLNAHSSNKRAGQIGRFGLGFKSLLRLGGRIDVASRSVGLRFDPVTSGDNIRRALGLRADAASPGLRIAEAQEWNAALKDLSGSERFSEWATTIVFAELQAPGAREAVLAEIEKFPSEFLLFLQCDIELVLKGGSIDRVLRRTACEDGCVTIHDVHGEVEASEKWRVFETSVSITEPEALADATAVHYRESVPLIWAAPVSPQRESAGRFYAFFPTSTETRTLGILNAPWKL